MLLPLVWNQSATPPQGVFSDKRTRARHEAALQFLYLIKYKVRVKKLTVEKAVAGCVEERWVTVRTGLASIVCSCSKNDFSGTWTESLPSVGSPKSGCSRRG